MNHCLNVLHILTRMLQSGGSERNTLFSVKAIHDSSYIVDVAFGSEYDENIEQKARDYEKIYMELISP